MRLPYLSSYFLYLFTITHTHIHGLGIVARKSNDLLLPYFNADSAYSFIQKQLDFGPRVPNTIPHQHCKKFLKKQLQSCGAKVFMQKFQSLSFDNKMLQLCNIIASFNPTCTSRILLATHWDTRPFADKDTTLQSYPILGANDGASGVGILLEIARIINEVPLIDVGIDIIFFDGEDYGPIEECKNDLTNPALFWCLGSQFWSRNLHQPSYTAQYGILLDMVGNSKATFYQEAWSMYYSSKQVRRIWKIAQDLGHGDYFINQPSGSYILDDHYFINKYAHIPMINIIDHTLAPQNCFRAYHHTHADNLELIDKQTLRAVGRTVLQAIFYASESSTSDSEGGKIIDHTLAPQNCFKVYHHTHTDNLELIDKQTLRAVGRTVLQAIFMPQSPLRVTLRAGINMALQVIDTLPDFFNNPPL